MLCSRSCGSWGVVRGLGRVFLVAGVCVFAFPSCWLEQPQGRVPSARAGSESGSARSPLGRGRAGPRAVGEAADGAWLPSTSLLCSWEQHLPINSANTLRLLQMYYFYIKDCLAQKGRSW